MRKNKSSLSGWKVKILTAIVPYLIRFLFKEGKMQVFWAKVQEAWFGVCNWVKSLFVREPEVPKMKTYTESQVIELLVRVKNFNAGVVDEPLSRHVDAVYNDWRDGLE